VVFAVRVQIIWRIRASRYKLTEVLVSCHVAEFLKRASARSAYTVTGSLSRYQEQYAKTVTSLCTLLSVLAVRALVPLSQVLYSYLIFKSCRYMLSELFATFSNRFEESELQICLTVNLWTLK